MPVTFNGRSLGVAENGVFTAKNTLPILGGRLWPEAALTWNAMAAAYVAGGGRPEDFVPTGPASSARSVPQQQHFWTHQPPAAARPGTSNHGWGLAVDVKTRVAAAWLLRNCRQFGWSHDEGIRVGEWWHFNYVGASKGLLSKLQRDPLTGYTVAEKRWIHEYDRLQRKHADPDRQRVLRAVMTQQRKRIFQAAQRSGWTRVRRRRYLSLKARTT